MRQAGIIVDWATPSLQQRKNEEKRRKSSHRLWSSSRHPSRIHLTAFQMRERVYAGEVHKQVNQQAQRPGRGAERGAERGGGKERLTGRRAAAVAAAVTAAAVTAAVAMRAVQLQTRRLWIQCSTSLLLLYVSSSLSLPCLLPVCVCLCVCVCVFCGSICLHGTRTPFQWPLVCICLSPRSSHSPLICDCRLLIGFSSCGLTPKHQITPATSKKFSSSLICESLNCGGL